MEKLPSILEGIASRYRGPGGAVAVVKDGELVGQHVWGFADIETRAPITTTTSIPICSISKQMVCAVLLDLYRHPTPSMVDAAPDGDVPKLFTEKLHELLGRDFCLSNGLTIEHLCHMQSGLRDYWALTVLWGSRPDGPFSLARDAVEAVKRIKSLHFEPGTEYSYSNINFYILGRVIEKVAHQPLSELLQARVFEPAGMTTASLCPETSKYGDSCVGYECNEQVGFFAATNLMEWSGDAGIVASLEDMIAYETYLHRSATNPETWYGSIEAPGKFKDGKPSMYTYGLSFAELGKDVQAVGHGGALRGYRLSRKHVPSKGLSAIVLFNHEANADEAASVILRSVLNISSSLAPVASPPEPSKEWFGTFLDNDTKLAITVASGDRGKMSICYSRTPETLYLTESSEGKAVEMSAQIDKDTFKAFRVRDNKQLVATRLVSLDEGRQNGASLQGTYRCDEIDSAVIISGQGGMLYGCFDGPLGQGPAHLVRYLGEDVWALACPRGLDATPPGDWTLAFQRDGNGSISGVTIGCWLAKGLKYVKRAD